MKRVRAQPRICRLRSEAISHVATLPFACLPAPHAALACCIGAEPSRYKSLFLSSPLFFSSSIPLSKMPTKERPPTLALSLFRLPISWQGMSVTLETFIYSAIWNPVFSHTANDV